MASASSRNSNASKGNKNKPSSKAKADARRARIEEQRRAERARERRNRIITIVASTAILAGLVGGGWYLVDSANQKEQGKAAPISGEKTWSKLSRNHVTTTVKYPMTPPVGGNHAPVWQDCNGNVYTQPLQNENAVHSLEHGAVWVTYNTKAADADVKALAAKVKKTPYTLMSPYPSESAPITLNAWGHQLKVNKASDPRVDEFLSKYVQGKQTPEPGAACTGGKSS
ncbi:DUF3105 domain-containing protein [Streptomyces sp. CdTB01]|uniref:DUF3105 domain-containing protein n=1 Tax=Streptomyces sp. CdTB01 TaxID=1725411 RepID=UPI00073A9E79|nr:DUF3105 domain-containing protein [Streptomyces sp. CdTB01]ALV33212.1 hypothetical protein AS200_15110 [Streptomyces sp. CdTB01]